MSIARLATLLALLVLTACSARDDADGPPYPGLFVVVRIPESLTPLERGAKYEDPLHEALQARGLGEVSGGGTSIPWTSTWSSRTPAACPHCASS